MPGKFRFSRRSEKNLEGVKPQLVAEGKSQTMNSRHLTGDAVDVVAYIGSQVSWEWPLYEKIAQAFKQAAAELGIAIEWGGDWKTLKDGPHFQLKR
ncbi:M15 family metallopeptidase [Escherichia coli]|nr:M15 family metallopeptidase [Escherichia coli]